MGFILVQSPATGETLLATPTPTEEFVFPPGPNDNDTFNGYYWSLDERFWVPGLPTLATWFRASPDHVIGRAVWYSPWIMEATAKWRALPLDDYVDGVSLMSPMDIGKTVWLRRLGYSWEGPFLVVDCARRGDIWPVIYYRKEVVEVGFETALRWGMVSGSANYYRVEDWFLSDVEVYKSVDRPRDIGAPIDYRSWWISRAEFAYKSDTPPVYLPGGEWSWLPEVTSTPTPTVIVTPTPTATVTLLPTSRPTITSTLIEKEKAGPDPVVKEKTVMRMKRSTLWFLVLAPLLVISAVLLQITQGTMEAIAFVISVLVGLFEPKPLKWVLDKLALEGQAAVVFVYAASLVVGAIGLALSKQLFEFAWTWDNALAIAGLMFAAATYAYHRLKDNGDI